MIDFRY